MIAVPVRRPATAPAVLILGQNSAVAPTIIGMKSSSWYHGSSSELRRSAFGLLALKYVDGPYLRINNRNNPVESLDVTNKSTADNAPIQLWTYSSGKNQQWQLVPESSGGYHIVNRNSAAGQGHMECLTVPGSSTADSVQLQQSKCSGAASQSFKLVAQP
jgi:hypothetical protein